MRIFHPNQSEFGCLPANIFYATDDAGHPLGRGFLSANCYPGLFPERPLQIFINVQADAAARDYLFGALMARAQILREQNPSLCARVFAQVNQSDPQLSEKMRFYEGNGLNDVDGVDLLQISRPNVSPIPPMGYRMGLSSLTTEKDRRGLLGRMNPYRLNGLSMEQLQKYMEYPHFLCLYLGHNNTIVGEAVFTGSEEKASLLGLYVIPTYRNNGFAKLLLSAGIKRLEENGVTSVNCEHQRSRQEQRALAASCNAYCKRTLRYYPGINYD